MLNKILVPLDGSPLATCVIPHLVAFTQATEAHITLLRVTEMNNERPNRVNPVDWHLGKVEAQMYLDEIAERLGEFIGQKPETQVLEGPAAERIIEYAQKHDFDLVVLSTHGQSGLNGWNVSSVAQKVINRIGKSILLVPAYQSSVDCQAGHWGAIHYRRILAPLDGSQRSESVLPIAAAVAQAHQAELILAHVVTRPEMVQRMPLTAEDLALSDQLVERNQTQVTRYFEQLENRIEPKPQTHVLVNAHVTASLYKLVEQQQIDLVLLSAHGNSGQNQWPYGSMVTSFILYGATPLLVMQDLPLQEIAPTHAERATTQTQSGWPKSYGSDEKPGIPEYMIANGHDGYKQGIHESIHEYRGLPPLTRNNLRNNANYKTERVGTYAYTPLL